MADMRATGDVKNLLLLGLSQAWEGAVCDEAAKLGVRHLEYAPSPREAMLRIAGGFPAVSHLLLQDTGSDELLDELVDLTAAQCPQGVEMVVLGLPDRLLGNRSARAITFVAEGQDDWLREVLTATARPDRPARRFPGVDEIKQALAERRIQTRYQPIVCMQDYRPTGLEVLARLQHPVEGLLQPDFFVPQIEAAGLAWALTQVVIDRAFDDFGDGRLEQLGLTLAINLPLDVLLVPSAFHWIEQRRCEAGIPACHLVIELTETQAVGDAEQLRQAITVFRDAGYDVAMDDVAPTRRDHHALLDLPFSTLKLDKELVRESGTNQAAAAFLRKTIQAAHDAGLRVIAEGVEDMPLWNCLQQLDVDHAQGFLVARPLPASAIPVWHHDWCQRHRRGN
jgi:EAL domain-containing protein (putative c-di-GMP-specific phosphodiesterase class I)